MVGPVEKRWNMSTIDLEPLAEEEELMKKSYNKGGDLATHGRVAVISDRTRFDAERLHQLITNHWRYTSSARARDILDRWDEMKGKFRKVMPVEYRRALQEMISQAEMPAPLAAAGE